MFGSYEGENFENASLLIRNINFLGVSVEVPVLEDILYRKGISFV